MISRHRLGWAILTVATLAIALAAGLVNFPEPHNAIAIDRAILQFGDGQGRAVTLPPSAADRRAGTRSERAIYRVRFDLPALPDEPLLLLIPATSQDFSLALNGEPIFKSDIRALWSEPMVRNSSLARLPRMWLRAGGNELSFVFESSPSIIPNYLTKIYVGSESSLASNYRLRILFEEQLKTMALVAQALLAIGILIAYLYRPRDPLFSWLAAATTLALFVSVGLFVDLPTDLRFIRPYMLALAPAVGFLIVGVALALAGLRAPRALSAAAIVVPAISCLAILSGALSDIIIILSINLAILIAAFTTATGIIAWGAIWRGNTEARLMALPIFLLCWFSIRDAGVILGFLNGSILLAPYVRPLMLAAILAILMRRLAMSLDHLDRANENLNARLAEREAELAALHHEDRVEAARLVREQERQRLTRDLHDGISGHLVSIIAMAERSPGDVKPIEQAAREALDDLRLVIYSLDLGDRELPLALANFRERLIPRLQRIGVELNWSIAELPEVTGVTPGNALIILRILQEALTNALKHGPACKVTIRGAAASNGMASILIENDGRAFVSDATGLGIENMRRRAHQLGGELQIHSLPHGVRVILMLPRHLPDFEDAAAG